MSNAPKINLESSDNHTAAQALLDESHEPRFVALWDDPAELEHFRDYIRNAESVDGWVNLSTVIQDFESDHEV